MSSLTVDFPFQHLSYDYISLTLPGQNYFGNHWVNGKICLRCNGTWAMATLISKIAMELVTN